VLKEFEHAKARGATIYSEVAGYKTNSNGNHATQPSPEIMAAVMRLASQDAHLPTTTHSAVSILH
jgi:3-oxoacyl-[acyl-carrier-protein] synthase II